MTRSALLFSLVALLASATCAVSAELKIFTSRALATVLEVVGPDVERTTGSKSFPALAQNL